MFKHAKICLTGLVLSAAIAGAAQAETKITIGTAGVTGVYFPAGGAICRLIDTNTKQHGIDCLVESTGGSIYNLEALRKGELDLGVTQSDWQYHDVKGTGDFAGHGPDDKIRSVFSLHSEPFTVLARADAGIETFDDLKGKRVNIGNPGSGMRATMETVMRAKGWNHATFSKVSELKAADQGQALCDDKVDAIVYAAGHPNGAIQEVTSTCETRLIGVDGPVIDKLLKGSPYYSYTTIPGGMYAGSDEDTKTFGVKATLVTSADVDNEVIYQVTKAVFSRFDDFKTLHPVFSTLVPEQMVFDGNTAPLHEGAVRYYKESGLYDKAVAWRDSHSLASGNNGKKEN
jgi:uncharacterized protein